MTDFSELNGQTLTSVTKTINDRDHNEALIFKCETGKSYIMTHYQECCEEVDIEDICGDLNDLLGSPILVAEESSNEVDAALHHDTWTFYIISTLKGSVTIRWYGTSNGYYSETVDFKETTA